MAISKRVEQLADKFGFISKDDALAKRNYGSATSVLATFETIGSAYVAPSVSGIGASKGLLTEWWFK